MICECVLVATLPLPSPSRSKAERLEYGLERDHERVEKAEGVFVGV